MEAPVSPVEATPGVAVCFERSLDLGNSLTIAEVRPLKGTLEQLLTPREPLSLDASRVERADTAGVQLLLSFCREAERLGLEVSWRSVSEPLFATASRLGLSRALGWDRPC